MWVKSLEIDEPKKFGSKGPSICSEHFDRKSLKRTLKGGWRISEGAKPLHIVSSRTGFDENMYLVSNRGKVAINIRENLCQKLNFCNNRNILTFGSLSSSPATPYFCLPNLRGSPPPGTFLDHPPSMSENLEKYQISFLN